MRWGLSWILAQLEPPLLLLWNELRLKLNLGSARASFIISLKLDEARAESWLSSSLHYYYFEMRWGSSWILAQLEPLLLLLSNEMRLELNIGSARAYFIISLKLNEMTWAVCRVIFWAPEIPGKSYPKNFLDSHIFSPSFQLLLQSHL